MLGYDLTWFIIVEPPFQLACFNQPIFKSLVFSLDQKTELEAKQAGSRKKYKGRREFIEKILQPKEVADLFLYFSLQKWCNILAVL